MGRQARSGTASLAVVSVVAVRMQTRRATAEKPTNTEPPKRRATVPNGTVRSDPVILEVGDAHGEPSHRVDQRVDARSLGVDLRAEGVDSCPEARSLGVDLRVETVHARPHQCERADGKRRKDPDQHPRLCHTTMLAPGRHRARSGAAGGHVVAAQVLVERTLDMPDRLGQVGDVRPDLRDVAPHLSELGVHLASQATDLSPHLASQATELGPHLRAQPTDLPAQQGQGCQATSDNNTDQGPDGSNHEASLTRARRRAPLGGA